MKGCEGGSRCAAPRLPPSQHYVLREGRRCSAPHPRPSYEQLRLALIEAAQERSAERDPPIGETAKGKTHKWRSTVTNEADEEALASL